MKIKSFFFFLGGWGSVGKPDKHTLVLCGCLCSALIPMAWLMSKESFSLETSGKLFVYSVLN